ncbi:MAG: copper chaperone CopZ, partial [Saprospiraceae bacterium]
MKHIFNIDGMTCQSCKAKVTNTLKSISGVTSVDVDLELKKAIIVMEYHIDTSTFQNELPD